MIATSTPEMHGANATLYIVLSCRSDILLRRESRNPTVLVAIVRGTEIPNKSMTSNLS
jgi:hypothetical protein